jgi:F-box and WD-40 domain protein CDC4
VEHGTTTSRTLERSGSIRVCPPLAMSLGDAHHPGLTGPLRTTKQVISVTSASSHPPFPSTRPLSNEYGFMEPGGRTSASSRRQASESSSLAYSELQLAPATRTSTVTTTTTTTVHFAPILIPRSAATRPSSSQDARASFAQLVEQEERNARDPSKVLALDPKLYPLSQSPWPGGMKQFRLGLGGEQATFYEGGREAVEHEHNMLVAGQGRDKGKGRAEDNLTDELPSHLSHAPGGSDSFNYGRDRGSAAQRRRPRRTRPTIVTGSTLPGSIDEDDASMSHEMDSGVDMGGGAAGARLPSPGPPRKRPRATSSHGRSQNERTPSEETDGMPPTSAAAMFSHQVSLGASAGLPCPNLSPPSPVPTFVEDDSQEFGDKGDDHGGDVRDQFDLGSGRPISALLALPDFVNMFDELSPALQSYFIYTFLKRSSIPVLQTINNIIAPSLRRDFLTDLPPELGLQVLGYLDTKTLCRASVVCKGWRRLVDGEWRVWKQRLLADELWTGDGSEEKEAKEIAGGSKQSLFLKRWKSGVWDENVSIDSSSIFESLLICPPTAPIQLGVPARGQHAH